MSNHGGARLGSGRPRKWGELQSQVTRGAAIPKEMPESHFERLIEIYLRHCAQGTEIQWLKRISEN